MKHDHRPFLRFLWVCGLQVTVLAGVSAKAHALGAIGFLDPQHTTVEAGDPFSGMELGTDWGNDGTPGGDHPTTMGTDGHEYAVPNLNQNVSIETWRTSTDLHLKFLIEDHTRFIFQASGDNTLLLGDQIIIQLDPDKSADTTLQSGGSPLDRDHRFEIVMRGEAIDATFHLEPEPGEVFWGEKVPMSDLASTCAAPVGFEGYCVELVVPLGTIGNPSDDVGIAIAVVNDLGHGHDEGGIVVHDVTGIAFPSAMGFSSSSEPGLIDAGLADGNWVNPSQWGVGYFTVAPATITFSHAPAFWWSNSIRLGRCDAGDWDDVQEPVTVGMNQLTLTNWYIYNPDKPCQMRMFFRAFKSGAGVVRRRLFVVWGRPGIAPQDWFAVQVTPPIAFTNAEEFLDLVWPAVPAVNFTSHPCLRVYLLPENLTGPFDEAGLMNIDTAAELTAMEAQYAVPAGDPATAQMNFNAIATGSCTQEACQPVIVGQAPAGGRQLIRTAAAAAAQERPQEPDPEDRDLARITAEGSALDLVASDRAYTIISPIGGVGWVVDNDRIAEEEQLELKLEIANPPIAAWNFAAQPPEQIPSPARQLVVLVRSEATPGRPAPEVTVAQPEDLIQPGDTVEISVTATPGTGEESPDAKWPWQYWVVVVIVVLILISLPLLWFFWRRRPGRP